METKFCSNCGAEIDKKAEICPKCGVRISPLPSQIGGAPTNAVRILIYIISFCLPLIGIIVGIIYWVRPSKEAKEFGKTCVTIAMIIPITTTMAAIIGAFVFGMGSNIMVEEHITPKYVAGDLFEFESNNNDTLANRMALVILGYDTQTDTYEIAGLVQDDNGLWVRFLEIETFQANRELFEEKNPEPIAHIELSTVKIFPKTTPTPKVPTELNLGVGETAKTSKEEVTVISATEKDYYLYYSDFFSEPMVETASPGKKFVIVEVEIKNIGRDVAYFGISDFSSTDSEGYRYDPNFLYLGEDGLGGFEELYQNQKIRGKILFEIPDDATGVKVLYDFGDLFTGIKLASWELE
ncbi:MAG: DUF4352 domain-containing protein [Halobacteriota archaeon]|nr:DUF4352 domain-containing protein [Halobacteriota archaeon]